jgi:uncharacterized membrane protein HdeD (DUF308 family)
MSQTTIYMDTATADEAASALEKIWWLMLLDGIFSLLIGFLVLSWTHQTLTVLGVFLGIWLVVMGILQLASGLMAFKVRWPHALMGVISLGVGIYTLANPHKTLNALAWGLGWILLLWGIAEIVSAFLNMETRHWWLGIIKGLVFFALGIWAIRHPGHALTVMVVVFGVTCVFWGAMELVAAFFARHAKKSLEAARTKAA